MRTESKPRRYGRFSVSAEFARQHSIGLLRIMGKCIVFRAEHLFASDVIEYTAQSDLFREIAEGEVAPEYQWFIDGDGWLWCEEVKGQRLARRRPDALDLLGIIAF